MCEEAIESQLGTCDGFSGVLVCMRQMEISVSQVCFLINPKVPKILMAIHPVVVELAEIVQSAPPTNKPTFPSIKPRH